MTNTYLTGNPLGSTAPKDLFDNASNFDEGMNSPSPSFYDRFQLRRETWKGMENAFLVAQAGRQSEFDAFLDASGYVWLGDYAAGLVFTRRTQYTVREDIAYRPALSADLPFTTTGVWATDQVNFEAFDVSTALIQDFANASDFTKGVTMIGGAIRVVDTFADIRTLPLAVGKVFALGHSQRGDGGGGLYVYDSTDLVSADNNGTIAVSSVDSGRWKLPKRTEYSPRLFGAKGDGVADDTVPLQACVTAIGAAGGGVVFLDNGTWKLSDVINISSGHITIRGATKFGSLLKQTNLSAGILRATANYFMVDTLSFIYDGTPSAGANALFVQSSFARVVNIAIRNAGIGITITNCSAISLSAIAVLDYETVGLLVTQAVDIYLNHFIFNAGTFARGTLGGIRLFNQVEAFNATDGDILLGVYSMTMDAAAYGAAVRPAYNKFTNVYSDSSEKGVLVSNTVETDFTACWFSCGRVAAPEPGCTVSQSQNIRFTGGQFFNNGGHGCVVTAQALGASFVNVSFESNSVTAGASVGHGLSIAPGTNGVRVIGCNAGNGLFPGGQQGYGVFIGTASQNVSIVDCFMPTNGLGAIGGDVSGSSMHIAAVAGFIALAKGVATVVVGQSVVTVTHGLGATPTQQDIQICWGDTIAGRAATAAWATNITSTTFQIALNAVVTGSNLPVVWRAGIKGN